MIVLQSAGLTNSGPRQDVTLVVKLPSLDSTSVTEEEKESAAANKVDIMSWDEFVQTGIDNPCEANFPTPSDLCTLCYTSG